MCHGLAFIISLFLAIPTPFSQPGNQLSKDLNQRQPNDSTVFRTHYVAEHWTTDNGLPINHINQIYQTPDGYIWLATFAGLIRFDGHSFTNFDVGNTPEFLSNRLTSIQAGTGNSFWLNSEQDNVMYYNGERFISFDDRFRDSKEIIVRTDSVRTWIGTKKGLYLFTDDSLAPFKPEVFSDKLITNIFIGSDGLTRIFDSDGYEWRIDTANNIIRSVTTPMPFGAVAVEEDPKGRIWLGRNNLSYLDQDKYVSPSVPRPLSKKWVDSRHGLYSMKSTPKGDILVLGQNGLIKIEGTTLSGVDTDVDLGNASYPTVLGAAFTTCPDSSVWTIVQDKVYKNGNFEFRADIQGNTIFCDREQNLWITTTGNGLYRYRQSMFRNITFSDSENRFYGIHMDSFGTMWAGSYSGEVYQVNQTGEIFSLDIPAGHGFTGAFLETSDGSIWNGINRCRPEFRSVSNFCLTFEQVDALAGQNVFAIHEDQKNRIWFGSTDQLYRFEENAFEKSHMEVFPVSRVRYFIESADSAIWMATNGNGVYRYQDEEFTHYNASSGLSSNNIRVLYEDESGYIWIASEDSGLNRLDPATGKIVIIRKSDGLFDDGIHQMLPDNFGQMWFSTNYGIFHVHFQQLTEFANGKRDHLFSTWYNERDGMLSREANGGFQNSGYKAGDGKLYFSTQKGILVVDPEKTIGDKTTIPSIIFEGIHLGGNRISTQAGVTNLAKDQRSFTVRYNSPFFMAPERLQFRYLLEGFDQEWIDAGNRREAIYTNIPAGTYTLKVAADLGNRESTPAITTHAVTISPYYHETAWFPIAIILLFCLLVAGSYQLRLRHLIRREKKLERLVARRTEDLRSEKQKTEEQAEQLKFLAHEKNRFFANISHEFRTPLTLTIGPLTDLRNGRYGPLSPAARQQADLSLQNARRLLRLVGQLMDLAKLEDKKFDLNLRAGDICKYLKTVAEPFKAAANQKMIRFNVQIPRQPVFVQFDSSHFDKIVANLLSNAFKFTPENGTITLEVQDDGDEVIISISDTGCGIDSEHLPHLFDRFYQIQKSEMQPGSGIGLSLAKELMELHKGNIDVKSKVNEGSTFSIRIPLLADCTIKSPIAKIQTNGSEEPQQKQALPGSSTQSVQTNDNETDENKGLLKSILIVDDHADIRLYLKRHLEETYSVIEASSGSEAETLLDTHLPDLVISDVMMPDGDGFSLLKKIRSSPEMDFLPVILLTARAEAEDKLSGLDIGANDYITKPFNIREVITRVKNLFDQQNRLKHRFSDVIKEFGIKIHHDVVNTDSADQVFLSAVKEAIQSDLADENFSVEELAAKVNQSRSNLHRRLTKLTGETPSAMIRRIRLELGAQLLSQNAGTVSEIAYSIGFKNVAHFSRVFREHFNRTPTEYMESHS